MPTAAGMTWSFAAGSHNALALDYRTWAPGVIAGFFTVVGVAVNCTFWPGVRRLHKCFKINARIRPNLIGVIGHPDHDGKDGVLILTKCNLQSTDYKSVVAYRNFSGDNAWSPNL